ncbi:hypothetical protein T492DRAFT_853010 [Pavlovales sp. CCMP2436]|nr:hypothetical protein T492DRAFT_853010 [Pavlovales sp. CCMP2436]
MLNPHCSSRIGRQQRVAVASHLSGDTSPGAEQPAFPAFPSGRPSMQSQSNRQLDLLENKEDESGAGSTIVEDKQDLR